MYKVKVFAGLEDKGYFLKGLSDGAAEFASYDEAYKAAEKIRSGSSIGVWCRVEKQEKVINNEYSLDKSK